MIYYEMKNLVTLQLLGLSSFMFEKSIKNWSMVLNSTLYLFE